MTFSAPFSRIFRPAFGPGLAAAGAAAWWLAGGAPAPVTAYDSIAASKAASLVNLVNPGTYDMTEIGTVTWSSGAWSGFTTSNYWRTGITPADGYSMIVQFADGSGVSAIDIAGSRGSGSARFRLSPISVLNNSQRYYGYGSVNQSVASRVYSGIMALTPTGGWYNGSSDGVISPTWSGTPYEIFLGCYNNIGTPTGAWNGSVQRFAIWSSNIAAYVAALTAAMAAL